MERPVCAWCGAACTLRCTFPRLHRPEVVLWGCLEHRAPFLEEAGLAAVHGEYLRPALPRCRNCGPCRARWRLRCDRCADEMWACEGCQGLDALLDFAQRHLRACKGDPSILPLIIDLDAAGQLGRADIQEPPQARTRPCAGPEGPWRSKIAMRLTRDDVRHLRKRGIVEERHDRVRVIDDVAFARWREARERLRRQWRSDDDRPPPPGNRWMRRLPSLDEIEARGVEIEIDEAEAISLSIALSDRDDDDERVEYGCDRVFEVQADR